jgi:hypothetical protein
MVFNLKLLPFQKIPETLLQLSKRPESFAKVHPLCLFIEILKYAQLKNSLTRP